MQPRSFVELLVLHIPNSCWLLLWRRPQETCLENAEAALNVDILSGLEVKWRVSRTEKDRCASDALVSSCTCINWNDSWTFHGCLTLFAISTLSDSVHKITIDLLQGQTYMCVCVCVCRSQPYLKRLSWSWRVFWVSYCRPYWKSLTGHKQQGPRYGPKFKMLR